MALPCFYIDQPVSTGNIILPEETSKHCIQVLRMKTGDQLLLTNGRGNLLTARISIADKQNCMVIVEESKYQPKPGKKISIAISLLKNASRFEWFLEKATEIGVSEIIPVLCQRTERQGFRFERMNNIVISAMLQSQQTWLPVLQAPQQVDKIISGSAYAQKLIAHCEEADKKSISDIIVSNDIQILIGPEGDFTISEIELAACHYYQQVSLGNTRLRTETSGIVAAALLSNSK
ncbi:MAG TPA: RsmE family RNA methyltransferase [Panacibacter sp.]|nr:RsmE family RNA methyltransferase [Panacibacter sp.]